MKRLFVFQASLVMSVILSTGACGRKVAAASEPATEAGSTTETSESKARLFTVPQEQMAHMQRGAGSGRQAASCPAADRRCRLQQL